MSIDEQHVAMPKLYGAPAYGRPPVPVATIGPAPSTRTSCRSWRTRPRKSASSPQRCPAQVYAPGGIDLSQAGQLRVEDEHRTRPRAFSIRGIATKIVRG